MSIAQTRENIVALLENIIKRTELMEKQSNSRNLLEIDLAMEDIRLLYREFEQLRMISEGNQAAIPAALRTPSAPQPREESPLAASIVQTTYTAQASTNPEPAQEPPTALPEERPIEKPVPEIPKPTPDPMPQTIPPAIDPPVPAPATPEPIMPTAETKTETRTEATQPAIPMASENGKRSPAPVAEQNTVKLVGERYSNQNNSVHERLTRIKEDMSIGARMQQKSIGNIKEAIGVNEKFLFINELFNGDLKSYNESIDKLNGFASIHEAFDYLNTLTNDFSWDGQRSAETIERFANLVQRRYMNMQ